MVIKLYDCQSGRDIVNDMPNFCDEEFFYEASKL